jgi:hypothetical protein
MPEHESGQGEDAWIAKYRAALSQDPPLRKSRFAELRKTARTVRVVISSYAAIILRPAKMKPRPSESTTDVKERESKRPQNGAGERRAS